MRDDALRDSMFNVPCWVPANAFDDPAAGTCRVCEDESDVDGSSCEDSKGRDYPACALHAKWVEDEGGWWAPDAQSAKEAECLCTCGGIIPWARRGDLCEMCERGVE